MHHLPTSQSEVCDLVLSALQQDVGWLQVAVDYVEPSQVPKALANLPEHIQYFSLSLWTLLFIAAFEEVAEISALTVLSDDVEVAVVLGGEGGTWKAS